MDFEAQIAESLRNMESKEDFIEFLELLLKDFVTSSDFWQNQDLHAFLSGLAGYGRSAGGFCQDEGIAIDVHKPSWALFADMLCGARAFDARD